MYEHPYLSQQVTHYEQQQMERAAEQRRFLIEHADQIVPRQAGVIRRAFSRLIAPRRASESQAGGARAAAAVGSARGTAAPSRGAAAPCEPIPAG